MDRYISDYFLNMLSTFHYMMTTEKDYERITQPNTTSPLYNFSLALNESTFTEDIRYKNYNYNGYPYDTFAINFV